ncbi:MAG: zeta toxin family protein [Kiritimatiellae bacterium]|nr:zeta toxin family protein [Kiritimatiellia bacterium]
MINRFRMVAGPNGSGKSTLAAWLARDYAVNFYTMLNADDVYALVRRTRAYFAPFPIDGASLAAYAVGTGYAEAEKGRFSSGEISVDADCVRFATAESVNSYTVALLVNFLQDECINRGISFSQETVFSHPSKVAALAKAKAAGFRTYLYYVVTDSASINAERVAERYSLGGHDVPPEKIVARYARSLANLPEAMPYLSRAFFFDNSGAEMRYLASYSEEVGLDILVPEGELPKWFTNFKITKEDHR